MAEEDVKSIRSIYDESKGSSASIASKGSGVTPDLVSGGDNEFSQSDIDAVKNILADNNTSAESVLNTMGQQSFKIGGAPLGVTMAIEQPELTRPYFAYDGSVGQDLGNSIWNGGVVRTTAGVKMFIPSVAKAFGAGEWANNWLDDAVEWNKHSQAIISDAGKEDFFDTFTAQSFAAGFGQGLGSVLPIFAAAGLTAATGGVAGVVGGAGWAAGSAAATAAAGTTATVTAASLNMLPGLMEEGLQNGLTHQQASRVALTIAPIIGAMEKVGLDYVVKAGIKPLSGSIARAAYKKSLNKIGKEGLTGNQFGKFATNIFKEIGDAYVAKGGGVKAASQVMKEELKMYGKAVGFSAIEGSGIEFLQETSQSLVETTGKQMYDMAFADAGATKGEGKFGADIKSKESWIKALKEGFYGGLVGASIAGAGRAGVGWQRQTILDALDSAKKEGKSDFNRVLKNMHRSVAESNNDENVKTSLNDMVDEMAEMVGNAELQTVTDNKSRMQILQFGLLSKNLSEKIDDIAIKNVVPDVISDINKLKITRLDERQAGIKKAVAETYETGIPYDEKEDKYDIFTVDQLQIPEKAESLISKEDEVKHIAEAEKIIDDSDLTEDEDKRILEFQERTGITPKYLDEYIDVPRPVETTIARVESGIPTDINAVQNAIEYLDTSFKRIQAAMKSDTRTLTTEQLESMEEQLGEQITKLRNYATEFKVTAEEQKVSYPPEQAEISKPPQKGKGRADQRTTTELGEQDQAPSGWRYAIKDEVLPMGSEVRMDITTGKQLVKIQPKAEPEVEQEEVLDKGIRKAFKDVGKDADESLIGKIKNFIKGKLVGKKAKINTQKDGVAEIVKDKGDTVLLADGRTVKKTSLEPAGRKKGRPDDATEEETGTQATKKAMDDTIEKKKKAVESFQKTLQELHKAPNTPDNEIREYEENIARELKEIRRLEKIKEDAKSILEPEQPTAPAKEVKEEVPTAKVKPKAEKEGQLETDFDKSPSTGKIVDDSEKNVSDTEQELRDIQDKNRGYDGSSAESRTGYSESIDADPVFYQKMTEHLQKLFPKLTIENVARIINENGVEILADIKDFAIRINSNKATQDSLVHEIGHKYVPFIAGEKLYHEGLNLVKDTQFYKDAQMAYPDKTSAEQAEEALMNMVAASTVEELKIKLGEGKVNLLRKALQWLRRYWNKLRNAFSKTRNIKSISDEIALEITLRETPITNDGAPIKGVKEQRSLDNVAGKRLNNTRTGYMNTVLSLKEGKRYSKGELKNILIKNIQSYWIFGALKNTKGDFDSKLKKVNNFLKKNESLIETYTDNLYNQFGTPIDEMSLNEILIDMDYEQADLDSSSIAENTFLAETSELSKKVRFVLDSFTNQFGIKLSPDRIQNISQEVSMISKTPNDFMKSLEKYIIQGQQYASDENTDTARNMYTILSGMDAVARKSLITSMYSLGSQPNIGIRLSVNDNGEIRVQRTNTKSPVSARELKDFIARRFRQSVRTSVIIPDEVGINKRKKMRAGLTRLHNEIFKHAQGTQKMTEAKLYSVAKEAQDLLYDMSGVRIKLSHFVGVPEAQMSAGLSSSIAIEKGLDKKKLTKYAYFLKNIIEQEEIFQELHDLKKANPELDINEFLGLYMNPYSEISPKARKALEAKYDAIDVLDMINRIRKTSRELESDLAIIADNISSTSSSSVVGPDTTGKQVPNNRIRGFLHNIVRKVNTFPEFVSGLKKHRLFNVDRNAYMSSATMEEKGKRVKINEQQADKRMPMIDQLLNRLMESYVKLWSSKKGRADVISTKDGIQNYMGESNVFQKADTLDSTTNAMVSLFEFVESLGELGNKKRYSKQKTGYYRQSVGLLADRKQDFYMKVPRIDNIQRAKELIHVIENSLTKNETEKLEGLLPTQELVDESIAWMKQEFRKFSNGNPIEDTNEDTMDNIIERFVYNDAINRWTILNIALGDVTEFVKANPDKEVISEVIKRFGGSVTPIREVSLGKPLRVVVAEDVYMDNNGNIFEGTTAEAIKKRYTNISDSQSYVNDFVSSKIRTSAKGVEDLGYVFKTVYNNATGEGNLNYIKTSSVSFQNVENTDSLNDAVERKVAKFLKRKGMRDGPVMVVFRSALKSPLSTDQKTYNINELSEKTELTDSDLSIEDSGFGIQLNISKDVAAKDATMALPNQMVRVLPTFIPNSSEQNQKWESLIAAKIQKQWETNILKGRDMSSVGPALELIDPSNTKILGSLGGRIASYLKDAYMNGVLPENLKLSHTDLSGKLQNYISAVYRKNVVNIRVPGGEMTESADLSGELKDQWQKVTEDEYQDYIQKGWIQKEDAIINQDGTYTLKVALVRVPQGFAQKGKKLVCVRIPTSGHVNIMAARIVGYTPKGSSRIQSPGMWVKRSDADKDGDKLFVWKNAGDNIEKEMQDMAFDMLTQESVKEQMQKDLEVGNKINEIIEKVSSLLGIKREGIGNVATVKGYVKMKEKIADARNMIDVFAVTSKMMNIFHNYNVTLKNGLSLFGGDSRANFGNSNINDVARGLQLMIDNPNHLIAHEVGFARVNVGVGTTLMMVGHSLENVSKFMKTKPIQELTDAMRPSQGRGDVSVEVDKLKKKYGDTRMSIGKGSTVSASVLLDSYLNAHNISNKLTKVRAIVQLDKNPAKNQTDVNRILRAFYDIEHNTDETVIDYGNLVEGSPLFKKYKQITGSLNKAFKKLFSSVTEPEMYIGKKKSSLSLESSLTKNIKNKDKSVLIDRIKTTAIARKMFLNKQYASAESVANELDNTIRAIEMSKGISGSKIYSYLDVDPDSLTITPSIGTSVIDIGVDANQDFDAKEIDALFSELSQQEQENLIKYAVLKEGFTSQKNGVTAFLGDSVFEKYMAKNSDSSYTSEIADSVYDDTAVMLNQNLESIETDVLELRGARMVTGEERISPGSKLIYNIKDRNSWIPTKYMIIGDFVYKSTELGARGRIKSSYFMDPIADLTEMSFAEEHPMYEGETRTTNYYQSNMKNGVHVGEDVPSLSNNEIIESLVSENSPYANKINTTKRSLLAKIYALPAGKTTKKDTKPGEESDNTGSSALDFQKTDEASTVSHRKIRSTMHRLASKYGIQYEIINDPSLKGVAGFYNRSTGVATINLAYVKEDTPFHEISHPFISAIKVSNPKLYKSLVNEIRNTPTGKATLDRVLKNNPELSKDEDRAIEEAIVELLGRLSTVSDTGLLNQLRRLLKSIVRAIKALFTGKMSVKLPSELNPDMTIADLSEAIVDGDITLDKDMDNKSKSFISKRVDALNKILNNNYQMYPISSLLNPTQRDIRSKIKDIGLMSSEEFAVVSENHLMDGNYVNKFRIPRELEDTFMDSLRTKYPDSSILTKDISEYPGYSAYTVDLGNGEIISVYKLVDDSQLTEEMVNSANMYFSKSNGTPTGPQVSTDMDDFAGVPIDDIHRSINTPEQILYERTGKTGQHISPLLEKFINEVVYKAMGIGSVSAQLEEDLSNMDALRSHFINTGYVEVSKLLSDKYNEMVGGTLSDILDTKAFEDLTLPMRSELFDMMFNNGFASEATGELIGPESIMENKADIIAELSDKYVDEQGVDISSIKLLLDTYVGMDEAAKIITYLDLTKTNGKDKGMFISSGKKPSYVNISQKLVEETTKNIGETKKTRTDWLSRNKWARMFKMLLDFTGKVFGKGESATGYTLNYKYNILTPKVFTRVLAGLDPSIVHAVAYDSPNISEQKNKQAERKFRAAMEESVGSTEEFDRLSDEFEKDSDTKDADLETIPFRSVTGELLTKLSKNKLLTLYKYVKQNDVLEKAFRNKSKMKFFYGTHDSSLYQKGGKIYKKGTDEFVSNAEIELTEGQVARLIEQVENPDAVSPSDNSQKAKDKRQTMRDVKTMADAINAGFDAIHPLISQTYKNRYGIPMRKVSNYFPLSLGSKVTSGVLQKTTSSLITDFRSIKQRRRESIQGGLRLDDSMEITFQGMRQGASYHAYANDIDNINKLIQILLNNDLDGYTQDDKNNVIRYLDEYKNSIDNFRAVEGLTDSAVNRMISKNLNNFQIAVLGLNPWVIFKQPMSMIVTGAEFGLMNNTMMAQGGKYPKAAWSVLTSSFGKASFDPKDLKMGDLNLEHPIIKEMMEMSPVIEERFQGYLNRDIGEYLARKQRRFGKGAKKTDLGFLGKYDFTKSMEGIKIADAFAITAIFLQVKDEVAGTHPNLTGAERNAVIKNRFEQVVNDTQPTFGLVNRTNFGRTQNPLVRIFTLFTSQRAKNVNIMIDAMNEMALNPNADTKAKMMAALIAVGLISTSGIVAVDILRNLLYGNYGDEEDESMKELVGMTIQTFLSNFYGGSITTPAINYILEKPFGQEITHPILATASQVSRGIGQTASGKPGRGLYNIASGAGKLLGVPTTPLTIGKKVVTAAAE